MDLKEAMLVRHSVRSFLDKRIEGEEKEKLEAFIRSCNSESGLHKIGRASCRERV